MVTLANFYQSRPWEQLVEALKMERVNDQGQIICEYCGKPIVKKYDCIGHHEIELTEDNVNDYNISLNPLNVKLIHFRCHNLIHQRFEGFSQSVYLVYGSPCSGKSTWVHSVASPDDLILDVDRIWEAVCYSSRYHKPGRLKANVFGIRDCIIDQIRTRTGKWRSAYVIGGYPLRSDRDRMCDLLGARPIFIDTSREECIGRAKSEEWKTYIDDWFDSFIA